MYLYAACRILDDSTNQLSIYVDEIVNGQMKEALGGDYSKYRWIIKAKNENTGEYVNKIVDDIKANGIELLFLNTIELNGYYMKLVSRTACAKVLTIININNWFNRGWRLNLGSLVKRWQARSILDRVDAISVMERNLENHIREHNYFTKLIFNLPFSIYEEADTKCEKKRSFVVPGNIEEKRRDYNIVIDAFQEVIGKDREVELYLLGVPVGDYGKSIIDRCEQLVAQGARIRTYRSFVDEGLFAREVLSSIAIISPIRVETVFDGISETYGKTKATGCVFDAIKYAKVGIFPEDLTVPAEIESSIIKYKGKNDLVNIMNKLLKDEKFLKEQAQNAINNSLKYSVNNIRPKVFSLIKDMFKLKAEKRGGG